MRTTDSHSDPPSGPARSPSTDPTTDTTDPLGAIISLLRPQAVLSKVVSGAGQWSRRYARYHDPVFCLIIEGSCFLDVDGIGLFELHAGDFVLLPETPGFTLSSDLGITPTPADPVPAHELRHGIESGPPTMRMLGGYFKFDPANAPVLVRLLPSAVHIRRDEEGAGRLRRIVELIVEETGAPYPGGELILKRLVEVLLVESLRFRSLSAAKPQQGLLAGLGDPALARTLRDIHTDVARRWTVADLARTAYLSRAAFAERFTRKVGMPPMQYLLEWRMAVAREMPVATSHHSPKWRSGSDTSPPARSARRSRASPAAHPASSRARPTERCAEGAAAVGESRVCCPFSDEPASVRCR